jgi:DNA-binding LacI/PurR family transcriptional regulator
MRTRVPIKRRPTIADIAARAGVSKSTASKFLSPTEYYVSSENRGKIAQAISDLGYEPNILARSLSSNRSYGLGVVVPNISNPFYPELVSGAEEVIARSDYTMILGSSHDQAILEASIVDSMVQRQVDGILIAAVTLNPQQIKRVFDLGVDVVLASRKLSKIIVDTVVVDDSFGAELATTHLIEHGYHSIYHLAGPDEIMPYRERRKGFEKALSSAGFADISNLVKVTTSDLVHVEAAALKLFAEHKKHYPKRCISVFAGSDSIALGVLLAAEKMGLRVPEDVAVVGFDNVWVSRMPGVSLTSIDGQTRNIGSTAANLLISRIEKRWGYSNLPLEPQQIVLRPQLITRKSCGCVDKAHDTSLKEYS